MVERFMLMSAEKDLVDSLDVDIIINRFAESSTQNEALFNAIVICKPIDIMWLTILAYIS